MPEKQMVLCDALSLMDQCIAFYLGQKLTYDNVLDVLGAVDTEVFSRMLRLILQNQVAELMKMLEDLVMQGRSWGSSLQIYLVHAKSSAFEGIR